MWHSLPDDSKPQSLADRQPFPGSKGDQINIKILPAAAAAAAAGCIVKLWGGNKGAPEGPRAAVSLRCRELLLRPAAA